MLEGLWVARFFAPGSAEGQLNGGTLVIETNRLLGGDSGYFYIGEVKAPHHDKWPVSIRIHRHDPMIESVFGDAEDFDIAGDISLSDHDRLGRQRATAIVQEVTNGTKLYIELTKVADLP